MLETVMAPERLPTEPSLIAQLLEERGDEVRSQLATQEGGARSRRLLRAADAVRERAARQAEKAAAAAARVRSTGGRTRVGDPKATPRPDDGQVRSTGITVALGEGVLERIDAEAERRTLLNQANGLGVVSRNEILRQAIDALLADPPRADDVSWDSLRGHTGERFLFTPKAGTRRELDVLTARLAREVGRGHLKRQRIHLIRHAALVYLAKNRHR